MGILLATLGGIVTGVIGAFVIIWYSLTKNSNW